MKLQHFFSLLAVFLIACSTEKTEERSRTEYLPYYNEATFTPKWFEPESDSLRGFHQISSFNLTNQDGELITEKTFEEKIYVTDFFFTICPGICPKMTSSMLSLQKKFANDEDVFLLSHSVMPENDSVEVLKSYAESRGIDSKKWHLVTGKREEIYSLGRNDYFVEEDLGLEKSKNDFLHTENFVLIDKNRRIRGIYNSLNKTAMRQLVADVETLKKEG
jgi:protein SCO1/2